MCFCRFLLGKMLYVASLFGVWSEIHQPDLEIRENTQVDMNKFFQFEY